jgi:hypothetical protein
MAHSFGSAGQSQTGDYVTTISGPFGRIQPSPEVAWRAAFADDGTLLHLDVESAEPDNDWRPVAEEFIREVLAKALADNRKRYFQRSLFQYIGEQLDGEYWLPGFRFAPVDMQEENAALLNAERVVALDLNVQAIDQHDVRAIAWEDSRRHAARLR